MTAKIQVYKQGDTAVVRGVQCDFKNIKYTELQHYIEQGWVTDIESLKAVKPKKRAGRPKGS